MNIKVKTTKERQVDRVCGGEYAVCNLEIFVSKSMSLREKQEVVIHAVIENWNRSWEHPKVEELTEKIMEGLDQLEGE